jgi:hypothetical protein
MQVFLRLPRLAAFRYVGGHSLTIVAGRPAKAAKSAGHQSNCEISWAVFRASR